jgi:hypothetical protein
VRRAHEQDAVRRQLDGAVFFEGASARGGRVDERLQLLVQRATEAVEIALTLLTMIPPRLCATKMIGRLLVCRDLALVWCLVYLLRTSVLSLFKHRSDTSVRAWSNKYWQLTRNSLCVFAS